MLRLLLILLFAANLAYAAWGQGWLVAVGWGPSPTDEPWRLEKQMRPEAVQLIAVAAKPPPAADAAAARPTPKTEAAAAEEISNTESNTPTNQANTRRQQLLNQKRPPLRPRPRPPPTPNACRPGRSAKMRPKPCATPCGRESWPGTATKCAARHARALDGLLGQISQPRAAQPPAHLAAARKTSTPTALAATWSPACRWAASPRKRPPRANSPACCAKACAGPGWCRSVLRPRSSPCACPPPLRPSRPSWGPSGPALAGKVLQRCEEPSRTCCRHTNRSGQRGAVGVCGQYAASKGSSFLPVAASPGGSSRSSARSIRFPACPAVQRTASRRLGDCGASVPQGAFPRPALCRALAYSFGALPAVVYLPLT